MASVSKRGAQNQEKATNKCTLFVRNLPFDATNDGLEEVFSEVGPIKSCFVVKDKGVTDKCRGFGFVTYADRTDAEKAIASAHSLDGRKLHVKFADKKPPSNLALKKKKQTGGDKSSPTKHSFFKNDDDDEDEDEGNTSSKSFGNDNQKQKGQKFGKQSPQKQPQLKNPPGQSPQQRSHEEQWTFNKNRTDKQQPDRKQDKKQQFNKKDNKYEKLNKKPAQQRSTEFKPPPHERQITAKEKTARLVIRNLSFKCDEDNLQEEFSSYGDISEVKIPQVPGPGGRRRGFAFVQFKEISSAAEAVKKMNGKNIMGRPIAVDWSLSKQKFLAVSKQAGKSPPGPPPKKEKPQQKKASSSSSDESSDEDGSDDEDSDDEEEDDSDSSEDDEDTDKQKGQDTKQTGGKQKESLTAVKKQKMQEDAESTDEESEDDEESSKEQSNDSKVKKSSVPNKSNKAVVLKSKPDDDNDDDDDDSSDDDSDNEEDMDTSESDSVKEPKKPFVQQGNESGSIPDDESSREEESDEDESEEDDKDDDDNDDDEEDDDSDSDEDEDDSDEDEDDMQAKQKKEELLRPSDIGEGKTLFVRNVPFESTDEDLSEIFSKFGRLEVCRVVMDKQTEHSKGSAFVKYASVAEAEKCLHKASSNTQDNKFTLDGRRLEVSMALPRNDIEGMRKALKKQEKSVNKDKRNLYLLREGLVREGTQSAKGVSELDMAKRAKVETIKRNKLKNINVFISPTRMVVHNLPKSIDNAKLKKMFLEGASDKTAKVIEARVMRDMTRPNADGKCQPLGFAFVEFTQHEHALKALRHINNNASYFGANKRPIVGFSLENKTALETKKRRLEKFQNKGPQKNEDRDRAKTGPSQSEVAKKTHIASLSKEKIHTAPKTKIRKGLPSHMGPKKRWRDKGKLPPPKKDKNRVSRMQKWQMKDREPKEPQNMKRPAVEQETGKPKKRRRKNADKREESNFNKLVAQYKNKLFANVERTNNPQPRKQPKSKWFNNSS